MPHLEQLIKDIAETRVRKFAIDRRGQDDQAVQSVVRLWTPIVIDAIEQALHDVEILKLLKSG